MFFLWISLYVSVSQPLIIRKYIFRHVSQRLLSPSLETLWASVLNFCGSKTIRSKPYFLKRSSFLRIFALIEIGEC